LQIMSQGNTMSLEQKIEALTEAVQRLTAVMQTAGEPEAGGTEGGETAKRTRRTKAQIEADNAAAAAAAAATKTNTTATTVRYFHIPKHNTVAAVNPGEPVPTIESTVEVSEADYTALKTKYAQAVVGNAVSAPAAAPAPATTTAAAPTSTTGTASNAVSNESLLDKCKTVHAKGGNELLESVLKQFAAANVPSMLRLTDKHAEIDKALSAALGETDNNLFG
jgi:Arc/MetJ family transcription regulator